MRAISLRWVAVILLCGLSLSLAAQTNDGAVHYIARHSPVQGSSRERSADRTFATSPQPLVESISPAANAWNLQAKLPGAVIRDLSFPISSVGYAVAELGQVWKTTDGGSAWTKILDLGSPYYWEGVAALTPDDIVISGFIDAPFGGPQEGIIRWSHDGGTTWTPDIILNPAAWSFRIRFADPLHGLVIDPYSPPNAAHYTTDGGAGAADWTQLTVDPKGAWFGEQFSLLPNLHARVSGITYCASQDGGAGWSCRSSIDPVFDGEVFFANDSDGWVGSGTIAPTVQGWIHRTTDGGNTWSGRTLNASWPIRQILFVTPTIGWAAGGNIYSNVGGIYFSSDGGQSWSLDLDSNGNEMDACDSQPAGNGFQIWCAGYDSLFNGVIYSLQIAGQAAMPTFSPAPGVYNASQSVSLADASPGATIHFTLDGSTPTVASAPYTGPITLSSSTTIEAMAVASGYLPSPVAVGTYTIMPEAAMPTFSPAPGAYSASQSVSLADASPGATIHYTMDGSTPAVASAPFTGPITVSSSTTIKAMAVASGYIPSPIAVATYTITPQLQVSPGSPSVTVHAGQAAIVPLTVGATATISSAITFSCSGLPAGGQCVFSPASLSSVSLPANVSLTITTPAPMARNPRRSNPPWMFALLLPGLLLLPGPGWRRIVGSLAGLLVLLAFASIGCGGGTAISVSPSHYAVTVTAASNGATSGTAQVELTINP